MNVFGLLRRRQRLSLLCIAVGALLLGAALVLTLSTSAHARSGGSVARIVEGAQAHDSQSWISKFLWHHPAGCPFYAGATVALQSDALATLATGDAFGKVLSWYEAQHRMKAELEAASGPEPIPGDIASYSVIIRQPEANYLVTVYKLRDDPQTYIDIADAE